MPLFRKQLAEELEKLPQPIHERYELDICMDGETRLKIAVIFGFFFPAPACLRV